MRKWTLATAVLLLTAPTWANTYFGGFEDTIGTEGTSSDYDYNDLVFSITGQNLALISNGNWYSKPVLGTSGTPFWNTHSFDGPNRNVGYCIYGGGNCGTGAGLDPSASYLASNSRQSVGDVYFSVDGQVNGDVEVKLANDHNVLGWYNLSDPNHINWFSDADDPGDTFHFTPRGDFGLVADNNGGLGQTFYSQDSYGTQDTASHFAFFGTAAPEPGQTGLFMVGLASLGLLLRRRMTAAKR